MGQLEKFVKILNLLKLSAGERDYWINRWDELNMEFGDYCYQIILNELKQKHKELEKLLNQNP